MKRFLILMIQLYKAIISPYLRPRCRFVPSCSEYAALAVQDQGAVRGAWAAMKRLLRCHPWGGNGLDLYERK